MYKRPRTHITDSHALCYGPSLPFTPKNPEDLGPNNVERESNEINYEPIKNQAN